MKKTQRKNNTVVTKPRLTFIRRAGKWVWRKKWWIMILAAIVWGISALFGGGTQKVEPLATMEITRGEMRQVVTATGEIQPLNTVSVGSQVSGTIEKLYVDFNSKVKKGDVLLEIEPSCITGICGRSQGITGQCPVPAQLCKERISAQQDTVQRRVYFPRRNGTIPDYI